MAAAITQLALSADDVARIRALTDEWVVLSLARDWDGLMALMTDDVVFLPPDAPIVVGRLAVRAFLDGLPAITALAATMIAAEGEPGLAWARGSFTITIDATPGERKSLAGNWAAAYRKRADHSWRCASITWSALHGAAGTAYSPNGPATR
jgi:ketosteroid isomerase-like protein